MASLAQLISTRPEATASRSSLRMVRMRLLRPISRCSKRRYIPDNTEQPCQSKHRRDRFRQPTSYSWALCRPYRHNSCGTPTSSRHGEGYSHWTPGIRPHWHSSIPCKSRKPSYGLLSRRASCRRPCYRNQRAVVLELNPVLCCILEPSHRAKGAADVLLHPSCTEQA